MPGSLVVGRYEFELRVKRPCSEEVGVATWQMDVVEAAPLTAPR